MLICKKGPVPAGSMVGDVLTEAHLKGTTDENKQETDLVPRSVDIIFFIPMTWDYVTGSITAIDVVNSFSALTENNEDPMDWIHSIVQANNDMANVGIICVNILGNESTYIHASYNSDYWHVYAPLINLTVITPADMPPSKFVSICSIMGITSILSVPIPSAALAVATTTIFVREDEKNQ